MSIVINGTGTITGISQGGLNDNIITKNEMATGGAWAPAGTVLQVVNATLTGIVSTSSTSFVNSGLTATITPTSATSKILALVNVVGIGKGTLNDYIVLNLVRGSTQLFLIESIAAYTGGATANNVGGSGCNYLDSPAATTATTYKVQFRSGYGNTVSINSYEGGSSTVTSTITLMEIAA